MIWCSSMLRSMVHQSNTTVFSIIFDAQWSAENVQDCEHSFRGKGLESLTLNEYNLQKTDCIISTQLCYWSQTAHVWISTTQLSSAWLTLLKHAGAVRIIFFFFWMHCDFIVLWVLPKQGFKMKGEPGASSSRLVLLMLVRVVTSFL